MDDYQTMCLSLKVSSFVGSFGTKLSRRMENFMMLKRSTTTFLRAMSPQTSCKTPIHQVWLSIHAVSLLKNLVDLDYSELWQLICVSSLRIHLPVKLQTELWAVVILVSICEKQLAYSASTQYLWITGYRPASTQYLWVTGYKQSS